MKAPEDIEAILQRLMPVAISQAGQEELDAIFGETAAAAPVRKNLLRYLLPASIAAAAAVALALLPAKNPPPSHSVAAALPGMVLVNSSERLESMIDEGFQSTPDGDAFHAMRLQMVEENTVRDEETGLTISISQPRDELVLVPVTSF